MEVVPRTIGISWRSAHPDRVSIHVGRYDGIAGVMSSCQYHGHPVMIIYNSLAFCVHHVAEALAHFEDVHHGVRAVAAAAAAAFGAAAAQHVGAHLDDVHDGATSAVPAERQSDEGASINDVRKIFF